LSFDLFVQRNRTYVKAMLIGYYQFVILGLPKG